MGPDLHYSLLASLLTRPSGTPPRRPRKGAKLITTRVRKEGGREGLAAAAVLAPPPPINERAAAAAEGRKEGRTEGRRSKLEIQFGGFLLAEERRERGAA